MAMYFFVMLMFVTDLILNKVYGVSNCLCYEPLVHICFHLLSLQKGRATPSIWNKIMRSIETFSSSIFVGKTKRGVDEISQVHVICRDGKEASREENKNI